MSKTLEALEVQFRVVGALLMREVITRYGRHNIGFMWLFVEPMLFTVGVTALWSLAGLHRESSIPIVAFGLTGYSTVLLWRNMPMRCVEAVVPNLALMYHRQVKLMDVFIARILLEIAGATTSFIVLGTLFTAMGWIELPQDILKIAVGWLMIAWFGASLAIFMGCVATRSEILEKLSHPAMYLLFPLSGAVFMVDWFPVSLQNMLLWVPMVHGIEMIRDGYFGAAVRIHHNIGYLVVVCMGMTLAGLAQERIVSRLVAPE